MHEVNKEKYTERKLTFGSHAVFLEEIHFIHDRMVALFGTPVDVVVNDDIGLDHIDDLKLDKMPRYISSIDFKHEIPNEKLWLQKVAEVNIDKSGMHWNLPNTDQGVKLFNQQLQRMARAPLGRVLLLVRFLLSLAVWYAWWATTVKWMPGQEILPAVAWSIVLAGMFGCVYIQWKLLNFDALLSTRPRPLLFKAVGVWAGGIILSLVSTAIWWFIFERGGVEP